MSIPVTNKGAIASGVYAFAQTETIPYMFMCTTTAAYNLNGQTGVLTQVTDTNFPTVGYTGTSWTGYIVGTTMTVTVAPSYPTVLILPNQYITATGMVAQTYIVNQVSGTTGGVGTYTVSNSQTLYSSGSPGSIASPATAIRNLAYGASYLDGSVYVLTTDGRIYGSNLEDSTGWNALNYLTKESEADGGVATCKHLNYILAWGAWSMEAFYDAAGPAPFSPLLRYDAAKTEIGCAVGTSVVPFSGTVAWIGQSREAGRGVFLLNGMAPQKISTTSIDTYLNQSALIVGGLPIVRAWAVTLSGHSFYVLTLKDLNVTLVYDLLEGEWYQWTSTKQTGTTLAEGFFTQEFFAALTGTSYTIDSTTGNVYTLSVNSYDDGVNASSSTGVNPIQWRIVTESIDGGNNLVKFFHSLEIMGDRVNTPLFVRHTDDDFSSWSSYRQVQLVNARPVIFQCGQSRKRAYEFYHNDSLPIRLHSAEVLVKMGSN